MQLNLRALTCPSPGPLIVRVSGADEQFELEVPAIEACERFAVPFNLGGAEKKTLTVIFAAFVVEQEFLGQQVVELQGAEFELVLSELSLPSRSVFVDLRVSVLSAVCDGALILSASGVPAAPGSPDAQTGNSGLEDKKDTADPMDLFASLRALVVDEFQQGGKALRAYHSFSVQKRSSLLSIASLGEGEHAQRPQIILATELKRVLFPLPLQNAFRLTAEQHQMLRLLQLAGQKLSTADVFRVLRQEDGLADVIEGLAKRASFDPSHLGPIDIITRTTLRVQLSGTRRPRRLEMTLSQSLQDEDPTAMGTFLRLCNDLGQTECGWFCLLEEEELRPNVQNVSDGQDAALRFRLQTSSPADDQAVFNSGIPAELADGKEYFSECDAVIGISAEALLRHQRAADVMLVQIDKTRVVALLVRKIPSSSLLQLDDSRRRKAAQSSGRFTAMSALSENAVQHARRGGLPPIEEFCSQLTAEVDYQGKIQKAADRIVALLHRISGDYMLDEDAIFAILYGRR